LLYLIKMGCKQNICDNPSSTIVTTEPSKPATLITRETLPTLDIEKYINLLLDPDTYKFLIDNKNLTKLVTKLTESLDLNTIYILMHKLNEAIINYQVRYNKVVLISDELLSRYRIGVIKPLADINKYIPIPAKADPIKQSVLKNISNLAELYHFLNYEYNLFTHDKDVKYTVNKWSDVPDLRDYIFKIYFNTIDNLMHIKVTSIP
jgi:hypothetical protein